MTFPEVIGRAPAGLAQEHRELARVLVGNPEGVTRQEGARRLGVSDRAFRQLVEDAVSSGWLPIVADRGREGVSEAHYRIAKPHEADLVDQEAQQHYGRAVSLHKRARGLTQAFQATHAAGSLFLSNIPDLEAV